MTRTTPPRPVDAEALFPELAAYRGRTTRLHPRPGTPTVGESSVGGPFLWPADEPWPVCVEPHRRRYGDRTQDVRTERRILAEAWARTPAPGAMPGPTPEEGEILSSFKRGRHAPWLEDTDPIPLLAVAQLYARDVPGLGTPAGQDLLQLLWCPFDAHHGRHEPAVVLRRRRSADVTDALAEQPEPVVVGAKGYVPSPCVLDPEIVTEHQDLALLPDELQQRILDWEGDEEEQDEDSVLYHSDLSVAPGWKVGGFAAWNAGDPTLPGCDCGPMELLLTVASHEWDNGSRSWIPLEDLAGADAMDASVPTQVTVGRWGSLLVYTCPTADPAHPPRFVFQG
ncbi:hypothetical protein GCM10017562_31090 [Streptomyces roseofulvus]|uniref:LigA protein n=2 Tax=Streptomyces TaxID=1883 RepID=A0ABU4JZX3_9ACTN|nr:hypothetical protein [Streptomyces roseolus]MDX2291045.1 hypothetical protein [Streptomyces roseolus]